MAVEYGRPEKVAQLLDAGSRPDSLFNARGILDTGVGYGMVKEGVRDRPDSLINGQSLVDTAAGHGEVDVVRVLLAHLPTLPARRVQALLHEAYQNKKNIALDDAAQHGSLKRVKDALAAGAAVDNTTYDETPMIMALRSKRHDWLPVVECLVAHGANINSPSRMEYSTPLSCVVYDDPNTTVAIYNSARKTRWLIAHGANVNTRDPSSGDGGGETALMQVAGEGDVNIMKILLAHGADVNVQDNEGGTALMLASYRYIGRDWTGPDADFTPAEARLRRAKRRLLRRYGANLRLKDRRGRTASDYFHRDNYIGPAS